MIKEHEATEVFEEPPADKPKFTIIIVLSILLGVLLVIIAAGGLVFFQMTQELGAQVRVVKNELKEKNAVISGMKSQLEGLSMQMLTLKEYAIARSGAEGKKNKFHDDLAPAEGVQSEVGVPVTVPQDAKGKSASVVVSGKPKETLAKPEPMALSCELIGKTPKEQEETLRRCVGVMDGTIKEKKRSR